MPSPTTRRRLSTTGLADRSGVLGTDPGTGELVPGGTYAQTRQALRNLEAVLRAASSSLAQVLGMTCFLARPETFEEFERAYREIVPSPPPARATVGAELVVVGAMVEIQATAIAGAGSQ